jgi:hypothetical protein
VRDYKLSLKYVDFPTCFQEASGAAELFANHTVVHIVTESMDDNATNATLWPSSSSEAELLARASLVRDTEREFRLWK